MSGQEHINEFKSFAGKLVALYSTRLHSAERIADKQKRLRILEKAMYKMENELNGKLADIIADAADKNPFINENQLEMGLTEISNSSIKELLQRNF